MMNRKGVTLIELVIVLAVFSILLTITIPRFGTMRIRWQLESGAQQLVGDLHRARVEALKRNDQVFLARTGSHTYEIRHLGARTLPEGVAFSGPDTVKFAAFGPAVTGAATYTLTLGVETKEVLLNASGFAAVH